MTDSNISTPDGDSQNNTAQLEKAITKAFFPYLGNIQIENMALIEANHYLLNGAKCQLELFQSIAGELPEREEIQVMAGSIVGFAENLINQLVAMEAITDKLSSQIFQLTKDRDIAQEALKERGDL